MTYIYVMTLGASKQAIAQRVSKRSLEGPNHLFFMTILPIKMFCRLMVPKNYWIVKIFGPFLD